MRGIGGWKCSRFSCLRAGAFALTLLASGLTAFGLDSDRRLTQYVHRIWQAEQGLPEVDLYSIGQTRAGYLWLGTYSGLVFFDGVRFTRVRSQSGVNIDGLWVRSVAEDREGRLWLATDHSGLITLENGVATQYDAAAGLPAGTVYCVFPDRSGAVWACTRSGLARLDGEKIQVYGPGNGLATTVVRAVAEAPDGSLWVGSEGPYLSRWDGSNFKTIRLHSVPASAVVRALVCSEDGSVWVGTVNGLVRFQNGKETLFTTKDGLAGNYVICLASGRDGTLWIGTLDGFSRFRNGELESFGSRDGLSQRIVHAIYEDREGSLWVGTKHGLNQFLDGRSVPYTAREGLPNSDTGPVLGDRAGNVWVGTLGGGIGRFDGRRFSVLTTKQGLASNTIYSLAEDARGDLWVGTAGGLSRLRAGRVVQTYGMRQGLPAKEVRCLFRDRSGVLWAGTAAGPAKFENGRFVQPGALARALPMRIVAIGEDGRGRLFFAIEQSRMYVYEAGRIRALSLGEGAVLFPYAFYTDPDGLLWIGTMGGGLKLLQGEKITSFRMRDGMYDTDIFGIVADSQDRLWLACSKGIFSVYRSSLLRFAAGDATSLVSTPHTPIDLLRAIESRPGVSPATWRAPDGRLWFSTIQGALVLSPQERKREASPPPVLIERVIVNGKPDEPYRGGRFGPGRENLEFQYTALSFLEPNRTTFRYLLEGFDNGWTDAGTRRQAFYTNLPPGAYRFRVMACSDGLCNEARNSNPVILVPYFYARPWFLLLCAGLTGLATWKVYQMRAQRWQEELALIVGERNRIARELHDTLIQGFSGITMQMQALAARLRSAEERATLKDIIVDAGNCLRETRRSVEGLRNRGGDGLASAIRGFAQPIAQERGIRLKLKLETSPHDLSAEAQYNLLRIAQEAITNAIKHSGARSIEIALGYSRNNLRLSVKDDGSGMDLDKDGGARSGHYGLIGMRERATDLGADLQVSSQPGKGTTVSVSMPLGKREHHSPQAQSREGERL